MILQSRFDSIFHRCKWVLRIAFFLPLSFSLSYSLFLFLSSLAHWALFKEKNRATLRWSIRFPNSLPRYLFSFCFSIALCTFVSFSLSLSLSFNLQRFDFSPSDGDRRREERFFLLFIAIESLASTRRKSERDLFLSVDCKNSSATERCRDRALLTRRRIVFSSSYRAVWHWKTVRLRLWGKYLHLTERKLYKWIHRWVSAKIKHFSVSLIACFSLKLRHIRYCCSRERPS